MSSKDLQARAGEAAALLKAADDGLLQVTADGGPSIGESQKVRGLWYAVGVWVKDGPGMGKLVADWMTEVMTLNRPRSNEV